MLAHIFRFSSFFSSFHPPFFSHGYKIQNKEMKNIKRTRLHSTESCNLDDKRTANFRGVKNWVCFENLSLSEKITLKITLLFFLSFVVLLQKTNKQTKKSQKKEKTLFVKVYLVYVIRKYFWGVHPRTFLLAKYKNSARHLFTLRKFLLAKASALKIFSATVQQLQSGPIPSGIFMVTKVSKSKS